jgi:ribonuclease D
MKVITTTAELETACTALRACEFVAVDTEFMRESTYWPILCLIQAAGGETEVIIDPMADGIDMAPFHALLLDETVTKVFHAARQDLEIFYNQMGGKVPHPIFDSQVAAMAAGLGDSIAYDNLVRTMLKRQIDKGSRFTDWSRRPLSDKQLTYAIGDVTHLRDLYPELRDRLERAGRLTWVAEEMDILTSPDTYRMDPEDSWKRLKLRKLTPKWLAALRAAAAWREREAQTRDMPRQRIIKDEGLYELAHAAPLSPDAMTGLRAVPRGFERSSAAGRLISDMKAAMADPDAYAPEVGPPPQRPNGGDSTTELLKVLLKMIAEDAGVAPRLIATVPDLEQIAVSDTADVAALKGWRRDVFGEAALKLKRGELALRLNKGKVVLE